MELFLGIVLMQFTSYKGFEVCMSAKYDFTVESLGECKVHSPIELSREHGDFRAAYVKDTSFVRNSVNVFVDDAAGDGKNSSNLMEKAGPREYIYFNPAHVTAGICTCGGLCPGLNDVIRAVVRCLWNRYGVRRIHGIQFGYKGFLLFNNIVILIIISFEIFFN